MEKKEKEISYRTQKSLETISKEVGKTLEEGGDLHAFMTRNPKGRPMNEFVLLFADSLFTLITNDKVKIGMRDIKVILRIIHYAQYGNLIQFPRKKIKEELGLSDSSFSKAMSALKDVGLVMEIDDGIYLNPQILSKGKIYDYENDDALGKLAEKGAKILEEKFHQEPNIKTKRMRKNEIELKNKVQGRLDI